MGESNRLRCKADRARSWAARYRGKIAIHAGKGTENIDLCKQQIFWTNLWTYEIAAEYTLQQRIDDFLPLGAVVAIADLVDCLKVVGKVSFKIGNEKRVAAVLEMT